METTRFKTLTYSQSKNIMADQFDRAQEIEYRDRLISLEETLKIKPKLAATGRCLYCFETIAVAAVNKRFCDIDCRDDYDSKSR